MNKTRSQRIAESVIGGIICFILQSAYWGTIMLVLLGLRVPVDLIFIIGWMGFFFLFILTSGYFGYTVGFKSKWYIVLSTILALVAGFVPLISQKVFHFFPGM